MSDIVITRHVTAERASSVVQTNRLHYLDWLRVLLIIGVFLFHAVHPFDAIDWHIKNEEQSVLLSAVMLVVLYPWGLPLFFLIAGAGSHFALRRRSGPAYAKERILRLFIPLIVGSLILTPYQEYLEFLSKGLFEGSFLDFLPYMIAERPFGLAMLSPRVFGKWGFHLWFLGFLFAYSILALPIFLWLKRRGGTQLINLLAQVVEKRGGIFLFIIPLVISRYLIQPYFPVEHDWADFIYTFLFFIAGYILFANDRFLKAVNRDRWYLFIAGCIGIVLLLAIFATGNALDWVATFVFPWSHVLWLIFSICSWCWALVVLILARQFLNFSNQWLVYGNAALMPFYLLHQPVIIIISFFVVQMTVGVPVKAALVIGSSFLATLGLVELFVRRFMSVRYLFGMKAE